MSSTKWKNWVRAQINRISQYTKVSLDSCLACVLDNRSCGQGRISMSLDQFGMASVCSNVTLRHDGDDLREKWENVRMRDYKMQPGCILEGMTDNVQSERSN